MEEQDEIRALVEKAKQLDDKELKPIQSLFSNLSGHLQAAFRLEKEVNKTEESHSQPKTGADSVEPSAPDNGGLKDGGEPETHKSEENNKDPGSKESDYETESPWAYLMI